MQPLLRAENRVRDRLNVLRASILFLCQLDGKIGNSRLNESLNGMRDLPNEDAVRLLGLSAKLIEIKDALFPIPISFQNPKEFRQVLEHLTATPDEIKENVSKWFKQDDEEIER